MDLAIQAQGLSKRYQVGQQQAYGTLRDAIAFHAMRLLKPLSRAATPDSDTPDLEFWALRDLAFEVKAGERLGIIGRNGAGKSTLLKILSRITEPTTGRIEIRGRVASLLEVGTGFHPELTGRENIYLNGAMLGMTKFEIHAAFDEIVSFAEIDRFLDTPVKRYSSGMYVRLAFSVAAHLSADILLVDEVLAVGDARFQEKCLGKMGQITADSGRTVLFVSHNLAAVRAMCSRAIFLDTGRIAFDGPSEGAITEYGRVSHSVGRRDVVESSCKRLRLRVPYLLNRDGRPETTFAFGESINLRFELEALDSLDGVELGFTVVDMLGQRIFTSHMSDDRKFQLQRPVIGKLVIDSEIDLPTLAPGHYRIAYGVQDDRGFTVIYSDDEVAFDILSTAKDKVAASGILWYTSPWRYAKKEPAE